MMSRTKGKSIAMLAAASAAALLLLLYPTEAGAQKPKASSALAIRSSEIRLRGVIQSVSGGGRRFVLVVTAVTEAGRPTQTLVRPRRKTIVVARGVTQLRRNANPALKANTADLSSGREALVIGPNKGSGTTLTARLILLGGKSSVPHVPSGNARQAAAPVTFAAPPELAPPTRLAAALPDIRDGVPATSAALPPASPEVVNRVVELVNFHRRERNLPAVTLNERLSAGAQAHSVAMAQFRFFARRGTDGQTVDERVSRAGYSAETLRMLLSPANTTADKLVAGWMLRGGPERSTLLEAGLTEIGVGYFYEPTDAAINRPGHYWTVLMAKPLMTAPAAAAAPANP